MKSLILIVLLTLFLGTGCRQLAYQTQSTERTSISPAYCESTNSDFTHEWRVLLDTNEYQYEVWIGDYAYFSPEHWLVKGKWTPYIQVFLSEISERAQTTWNITFPAGVISDVYPASTPSANGIAGVSVITPTHNPQWQSDECDLAIMNLYDGTKKKVMVKRISHQTQSSERASDAPAYCESTNSDFTHEWRLLLENDAYQYEVWIGDSDRCFSTKNRDANGLWTPAIQVFLGAILNKPNIRWQVTYPAGGSSSSYPTFIPSADEIGEVIAITPFHNPEWMGDKCVLAVIRLPDGIEKKVSVKRTPQPGNGAYSADAQSSRQ